MRTQLPQMYEQIAMKVSKSGPCPYCGERVRRSKTFTETQSPFNKNPDGTLCSEQQIRGHLRVKCSEWAPDFRHRECPR